MKNVQTLSTPGKRPRVILASLLLSLAAACSSGGGSAPASAQPQPAPQPPVQAESGSYLSQAVNLGQFFRWTAGSASSILVPIQVDDVNVPQGFNAALMRSVFEQARDAWKPEIRQVVGFDTSTTRLSTSPPRPASEFFLAVNYVRQLTGATIGVVNVRFRPGVVTSLTMTLALESPLTGQRLTRDQLLATAIHEFGHAYGIFGLGSAPGHSPSNRDIMFESTSRTGLTGLSPSDAATIRDLYRRTPTTVTANVAAAPALLAPAPQVSAASNAVHLVSPAEMPDAEGCDHGLACHSQGGQHEAAGSARIAGSVRHAVTDAAVPGATIALHDLGACCQHNPPTWNATAAGAFVLEDVPSGRYRVVVHAPGYLDHVVGPITVGEGSETALRALMTPGLTAASRIVSGLGEPLAGARIHATPLRVTPRPAAFGAEDTVSVPRTAVSGPEGRVALSGLAPGQYSLRVVHDDWPTQTLFFDLTGNGTGLPVNFELTGGTLGGLCLRNGQPVPAAQVLVESGRGPGRVLATRTGHDGRFLLQRVQPGIQRVRVLTGDGTPSASVDTWWEVAVDPVHPTEAALELSGASLRTVAGQIRRGADAIETGRLIVTGAPVGGGPRWAPVEIDFVAGAFAARLPRADAYQYRLVWGEGANLREHSGVIDANADLADVLVRVPTGQLRVWLTDRNQGPVRRAVRLLRSEPGRGDVVVRECTDSTVTDARGVLTFENLPAGDYIIECPSLVAGAPPARTARIPVAEGTVAEAALVAGS